MTCSLGLAQTGDMVRVQHQGCGDRDRQVLSWEKEGSASGDPWRLADNMPLGGSYRWLGTDWQRVRKSLCRRDNMGDGLEPRSRATV